MYHSMEQLVAKIQVMLDKAVLLEKEHLNKTKDEVKYRLDDIRALAGDIYNDNDREDRQ